ncbi:MAG: LysR family transcriptional regulator [Alphaproteobacteria bacterium]|nr:LysR family transcriptional regulator [Alphaproteobacteria bacterium]
MVNPQGMDWDDLRLFKAVAEGGSLSTAATALGINHTTVFRRLNGLEKTLGVRLFDRRRSGYLLTASGEELAEAAGEVAGRVDSVARRIQGRDVRLRGPLRVVTRDTLLQRLLTPHLAGFREAYPLVDLELIISNQPPGLNREAHVAVSPTNTPDEQLVGRRAASIAFAVYGAHDYLALNAELDDLTTHDWIEPSGALVQMPPFEWMRRTLGDARVVFRVNTYMGVLDACRAGMGLALLPCFLADDDPRLNRVAAPNRTLDIGLWLLTHEELRHTARVRAFLDFMGQTIERVRPVLEGEHAADSPDAPFIMGDEVELLI